jgi:hypothetical protein
VVPATAAVALAVTTLGGSPAAPTNPTPPQPGAASGTAPVYDETPEQTRQRLANALTDGITAALPGVALTDGPTGQAGVSIFVSDDLIQYDSDTVLTTATGEGELFFVSWRGGDQRVYQTPTPLPADGPLPPAWFDSCSAVPTNDAFTPEGYRLVPECEESVGAQGQTIVVTSQTCVDCPGQPTVRRDAYVTWTNARVLMAIVNDLKRNEPPAATPTAELLLTKEQLVAIASDPELTVAA